MRFQKPSKLPAWGEPGWCGVEAPTISLWAVWLLGLLGSSPHPPSHKPPTGLWAQRGAASHPSHVKQRPLDTPGLLSGAGDCPQQHLSDQPNTSACSWDGKASRLGNANSCLFSKRAFCECVHALKLEASETHCTVLL